MDEDLNPVLIVEDDPAVREMLGYALADEGLPVRTVGDAYAAVLEAEAMGRPPSVVIVDMDLPIIGGETLAAEVERTFGHGTPVVLISGVPHVEERTRKTGATAFFPKPFDLDELVALVRRLASLPRRRLARVEGVGTERVWPVGNWLGRGATAA